MSFAARLKSWGNELTNRLDTQIEEVRANPVPTIVALAWFALTYATTVWVWGINPKIFFSPDEALNRLAAGVLSKRGEPFLTLPFPDPEDLAHPRHWVTHNGRAIPSYAPVAIYGYALFLRLHGLGWVTALPAMASAAFAVGLTRLLPRGRQWLALPAPLLGFPALYWLTRPWMNLSVLLICVCWAFFFWATWRSSQRPVYLTIAIGWVGAAAAVRPDYAAYLMTVALLLGIGQAPQEWRRVVTLVLVSGSCAVLINLFLNWLVTDHPTLAAYQIVAARDEGPAAPTGPLALLNQVTLPMGIPPWGLITRSLNKYWVKMGPAAGLLLALPGLVVVLWRQKKLQIAFQVAAVLVFIIFVLSRMAPDLNGATERRGWVDHSMPRYWSPVYLMATVPVVLMFGKLKSRVLLALGGLLLAGLGFLGGRHIWDRDKACFVKTRVFVERNEEALKHVKNKIPPHALVYTVTQDKILWPHFRLATLDLAELDRSVTSIRRAVDSGFDVYVYEARFEKVYSRRLQDALRTQRLGLVRLSWGGVFRIRRLREQPVVSQEDAPPPAELGSGPADDGPAPPKEAGADADDDPDAPDAEPVIPSKKKTAVPPAASTTPPAP